MHAAQRRRAALEQSLAETEEKIRSGTRFSLCRGVCCRLLQGRPATPIEELNRRAEGLMGLRSQNRMQQRGSALLKGVLHQVPRSGRAVAAKSRNLLEVSAPNSRSV